jgi:hypothetical protein
VNIPLQPCINTAAGRRSPPGAGGAGSKSIPDNSTSAPGKRTACSRIGAGAAFGAAAGFAVAGGFVAQPPAQAIQDSRSTAQIDALRCLDPDTCGFPFIAAAAWC